VNQLNLEDYVRGVVGGESPSTWPAAALQAQAIAARSYAVTTTHGAVFDQYPDTRSQMYRGVAAETASTNAAVAATTSEFVTYKGQPVTTFFFSSSGGETENIENSFLGATPEPYLTSVADPWDKHSPDFRWQVRYTRAGLQAKLGSWVKGTLESIDIIKRGISPRIVRADVVGSGGRTSVTGPQLRTRLGLKDTWVQFIFSSGGTSTVPKAPTATPSPTPAGPATGGAAGTLGGSLLSAIVARPPGYTPVHGRVWPQAGGRVVRLERRDGGRWRTVQRTTTDATGRWTALVPAGARYRVAALGVPGPVIDAR
jgi:stage II sporulation protein D